jgi:hypothetical protein
MRKTVWVVFIVLFAAGARSQSLTATSILQDSQNRVSALEEKVDSINGTLTVSVRFKAAVLGKNASGDARYRITVANGRDAKNELVGDHSFSDTTVESMMNRELRRRLNEPIMKLYLEAAFPWTRFLPAANKKREFTANVDSNSTIVNGRNCILISYTMDAEGDSVSADGEGKIWLDSGTLLPVRTYRDFNMRSRRGKAEVKSYSDFSSLNSGVPVMVRSETETIPKFLFISVGSIRTVVEQSDFNLE